jgi:hypothetical protein
VENFNCKRKNDAIAYLWQEYQNVIEAIEFISSPRKAYLQKSFMCREFERLCSIESLSEYTLSSLNQVSQYDFKRDICRHLNLCHKTNMPLYIKSNKGFSVKIAV